VTITKNDATTVIGSFVSADVDQVTLKPPPKPGKKEESEPVSVPWSEIKRISNGMMQAKFLTEWKAEHRDQLCETCRGDRTILCPTCKGTMHDPASAKDCKTCGGELLVDCKGPTCDKGIIPCPNTCLKLTEGKWVKHDDGKLWRKLPNGWSFSDAHVGDLIFTDPKTKQSEDKGKCPTCGGKTTIDCPICHGLAKVPCATCLARKDAAECPDHCDKGRVKCTTCEGTGLKK
jgi:hypothetical protein